MKAILVIDIPDDADIKALRANYEVYGDIRIKPYYQSNYRVGEGVKLKPMPLKRETMIHWKSIGGGDIPTHEPSGEDIGWNKCVEYLEGELND